MSNDLSAGLAVAGFALAVVSLTWQFWFTHRVDRARLRVTIDKLKIVTPGEIRPTGVPHVERVIGITVTNVGRRATVVHSINSVLGKRHRIRGRIWPKRWRPTYDVVPYATEDTSVTSTSLPCRLEPGDEANSYINLERLTRIVGGRTDRRVHALVGSSTAGTRGSRPVTVDPQEESD